MALENLLKDVWGNISDQWGTVRERRSVYNALEEQLGNLNTNLPQLYEERRGSELADMAGSLEEVVEKGKEKDVPLPEGVMDVIKGVYSLAAGAYMEKAREMVTKEETYVTQLEEAVSRVDPRSPQAQEALKGLQKKEMLYASFKLVVAETLAKEGLPIDEIYKGIEQLREKMKEIERREKEVVYEAFKHGGLIPAGTYKDQE